MTIGGACRQTKPRKMDTQVNSLETKREKKRMETTEKMARRRKDTIVKTLITIRSREQYMERIGEGYDLQWIDKG